MSTKNKLKFILIFLVIIWAIRVLDFLFPIDLNQFGIQPRTINGLIGIIFSPLLHANFIHLSSNSIPLIILLLAILFFYPENAIGIILLSVLLGGTMVWLFARSAIHIGASGLIYSMAAYLIAIGFYNKDTKSIIIAVITIVVYGSLVWGIFPTRPYISWEGHLFGAIAGVIVARIFRKQKQHETN